ncbi:MAG: SDR family NAD(P)-dependent oxidoreductase [Nitratireductor sp.]
MALFNASPSKGAAWITGTSAGLGEALACELAGEGYTVYASARSADKLETLAAEHARKSAAGRIVALPLDVTDRQACEVAVERIIRESGRLALAVFNAGTFYPMRAFKMDAGTFDKTMEINFFGVINGLVPAVLAMKQAGQGQIVVVSSSAGYGGLPKSAAYGASKAALINMASSLKFDLDAMNIRIQVCTPGFIDTPLTKKNDFPMPYLMPVDKAAKAFSEGIRGQGFDITFPKRFTWQLKALNLLPYRLYFWLVGMTTGSSKRRR